jgi:hypothetical protein
MNSEQTVNILIIAAASALLIYFLYSYNANSKEEALPKTESFYTEAGDNLKGTGAAKGDVMPVDSMAADNYKEYKEKEAAAGKQKPNDCFPRDRLTAEDLLPKDAANSKWAQVNPAGQGDVKDQNFLTAGYHVGINTIGSTRRNANLNLRSEPVNPQLQVSPWNQTTIEPDINRRALEIGGDF